MKTAKFMIYAFRACIGPVREVVVVAAKLTGTNSLGNALAQAGFDAAQLLEGINM